MGPGYWRVFDRHSRKKDSMTCRNVTVVGLQWGDEGKGKIVDWLSGQADAVVRFQGGHNAGHTLVVDGEEYILSLVPSGILHGGTLSLIGSGVVVDPWALSREIDALEKRGVDVSAQRLTVAENAVAILPSHGRLDQAREKNRIGADKIGTTGRGIGPAYEDKVARRAVRLGDLKDPPLLRERLDRLLAHHNILLRGLGEKEVDPNATLSELTKIGARIKPYIGRVWQKVQSLHRQGRPILFEGAQGTMLDIEYGTYPYVTSSNTLAAQAAIGSGIGADALGYVLGIAKAYTTRVGGGPFPTELDDDIGTALFERGREFGAVTGRRRRCGWFDAVLVRYACRLSGVHGVALTKLDVLDGVDEIRICTGYRWRGKTIDYYPHAYRDGGDEALTPIYESFPGWKCDTRSLRDYNDMPKAMADYVRALARAIDCPLCLLSTSPRREDTIVIDHPFSGHRGQSTE